MLAVIDCISDFGFDLFRGGGCRRQDNQENLKFVQCLFHQVILARACRIL